MSKINNVFSRRTALQHTLISVAAASALALTGCGAADNVTVENVTAENGVSAPTSVASSATAVSISETWAKAIDSGMTSAFGTIKNPTDQYITVTGVSTPASKTAELHEVVTGEDGSMKMRAKEGGFTIPAHGELILKPGAEHIMLMGLLKPVQAGDDITLTLELSNGQIMEFTALVKDFSGANENYGDMDHEGMDHGDMDHEGINHGDMDHGSPTDAK